MAALGKATLTGGSGKKYRFRIYSLGTRFRKLSGVYVITNRAAKPEGGHRHQVLYVDQTDDLSLPLAEHCKAEFFREHGANCICLQSNGSEVARIAAKNDLMQRLQPAGNRESPK